MSNILKVVKPVEKEIAEKDKLHLQCVICFGKAT